MHLRYKLLSGLLAGVATLLPTITQAQSYCEPPFEGSTYAGIVQFTMNSEPPIDRSSDWSETYMPTGIKTKVVTGLEYTLAVTTVNTMEHIFGNTNSRVWIDWNGDKDFEDAGEMVGSWDDHELAEPQVKKFKVPDDAKPGLTRMRVYTDMIESGGHDSPTPCGYHFSHSEVEHHGEVEDYDLTIEKGASTNQPPVFETIESMTAREDEFYDVRMYATDADGDAVSYETIHKPEWATVTPITYQAKVAMRVHGVPSSTDVGMDSIVMTATDNKQAETRQSFVITIEAKPNNLPTAAIPLTPANNASVSIDEPIVFAWSRSEDADQDFVIYSLTIKSEKVDLTINDLTDTFYVYTEGKIGASESVMWTVRSNDQEGGEAMSQSSSFSTTTSADVHPALRTQSWLLREFPLPARTTVTVQATTSDVIDCVELYDASGRLVDRVSTITREGDVQSAELDVSALAVGVYTAKVISTNGSRATKIQVVR